MTSETRSEGAGGRVVVVGWEVPEPTQPCPCLQVKEMSLIRNTIMECQVCGEWQRGWVGARWCRCACPLPALPGSDYPYLTGFHEQRSHCSPSPCFRGVDCMEVYEYPGFRCGPCPPGLQGNGTHCSDVNEVGVQNGRGAREGAGGASGWDPERWLETRRTQTP